LVLLALQAVRHVGDYVEVGKISSELCQLWSDEVKWTVIEAQERLTVGRLKHRQLALDSCYAILRVPWLSVKRPMLLEDHGVVDDASLLCFYHPALMHRFKVSKVDIVIGGLESVLTDVAPNQPDVEVTLNCFELFDLLPE
jgi:hypothetical protein